MKIGALRSPPRFVGEAFREREISRKRHDAAPSGVAQPVLERDRAALRNPARTICRVLMPESDLALDQLADRRLRGLTPSRPLLRFAFEIAHFTSYHARMT